MVSLPGDGKETNAGVELPAPQHDCRRRGCVQQLAQSLHSRHDVGLLSSPQCVPAGGCSSSVAQAEVPR